MIARARETYREFFSKGLKPDPQLTVSEWSDEFRILSQAASAEPGQWRTSRVPYLKEVMDCLSVHSPIQEVVVMKGAQLGFTEAGTNWIGYIVDAMPGPTLVVQPTVELAKRYSKQRIDSLVEGTPRLSEKVRDPKSRDSGNTVLAKEFPGGILVMTGANSAVGLRSLPAKNLMLDEVDAYPGDVDGEGDPVALAQARSRTFARRKCLMISTPKVKGRSRIDTAFDESDKRKYNVPCPHCKKEQILKFDNLKWDKTEDGKHLPDTTYYECEHCQGQIYERHKSWMLANGKWVAENPGAKGGKSAGFHISSLYSPVGWMSWVDIVKEFLQAKKDPARLKGFVNTVLGECWAARGDAPEWRRLYERREKYKMGMVPRGAVLLTAGVDVQKDRLEVQIIGWGPGKESWSVDYRVIPGDTATQIPWIALDQLLTESFPHECGNQLAIRMLAVDSGYNTQQVYSWARRYPISRVIAVKGMETLATSLGQPSNIDMKRNGQRIKTGFKIWPVGSNIIKSELYAWLRLDKPLDGEAFPPGYCHFPEYGEEFFQQLTAEEVVIRTVRGYQRHIWEKMRERNEALDTFVYARAAAAACGMDRFTADHWNTLAAQIGAVLSVDGKTLKTPSVSQIPVDKKPSNPLTLQRRKSKFL